MNFDHPETDEAELIEQLRRLPKVNVPDGLRESLLQAVPQGPRRIHQSPKRGRRKLVTIAIAASLLLTVGTSFTTGPSGSGDATESRAPPTASDVVSDNSNSSISKETDPCNILPPFLAS